LYKIAARLWLCGNLLLLAKGKGGAVKNAVFVISTNFGLCQKNKNIKK
jgi:hypothetical protein